MRVVRVLKQGQTGLVKTGVKKDAKTQRGRLNDGRTHTH